MLSRTHMGHSLVIESELDSPNSLNTISYLTQELQLFSSTFTEKHKDEDAKMHLFGCSQKKCVRISFPCKMNVKLHSISSASISLSCLPFATWICIRKKVLREQSLNQMQGALLLRKSKKLSLAHLNLDLVNPFIWRYNFIHVKVHPTKSTPIHPRELFEKDGFDTSTKNISLFWWYRWVFRKSAAKNPSFLLWKNCKDKGSLVSDDIHSELEDTRTNEVLWYSDSI